MQFRPEWHVMQYALKNWHQGVPNPMTPESRLQCIMKNTSRQLSEHFSHTWKHTTRRAKLLHPHTVHIQSAAARPAFAIAPRLDPPGKDPGPPVGLLLFDNPVPKQKSIWASFQSITSTLYCVACSILAPSAIHSAPAICIQCPKFLHNFHYPSILDMSQCNGTPLKLHTG